MEYLIVILIALGLALKNYTYEIEEEVIGPRETRLNPDFYEDEDAFMEVAHALGFRVNNFDTVSGGNVLRTEPDDVISSYTEGTVPMQNDRKGLAAETRVHLRANRVSVMDRIQRTCDS